MKSCNHSAMRFFTALALCVLLAGSFSFSAWSYQSAAANQGEEPLEVSLAEAVLLTLQVVQLDCTPKEKVGMIGNALGWHAYQPLTDEVTTDAVTAATPRVCNQYLSAALLLDVLDTSVPSLGFLTGFFYLASVLCYLGVI